MQYSNFIMKNNVHATLSTALSSVATTIQLTTGQGARFGTKFPQIATLESFDDTGKVVKREIVQITARNDDDLTVVRAFAPCPANDDANSQSQSSVSFSADDQISLYIPKEIFDKISQSMNDIYNNGTNNMRTDLVSGLQVEVNPGSVLVGSAYYDFAGGTITLTDNATNYLEIDEDGNLANNTTSRNDQNTKLAIITTAGGSVTKIQDWRLGTVGGKIGGVNIHDLTEKASLSPDDEFIISDSEAIFQNKKIKASTISKTIGNNNKLNIDFVLISGGGAGGRGYLANGASGGGGGGQLIEGKAVLNRGGEYSVIIGLGGQTNSASGGGSLFLGYFCYGGGGGGSGDGISGANGGGGAYANGVRQGAEPTNYHPLITGYRGGNGNSFAGGGGGGAGGAGGNGIRQGEGGLGGIGISNNITGISVEYCKGGVGGYHDQKTSGDDGVNYGDGGGGTGYSAGSGATGGKGKGGALIISYPETNDFTIIGATTSFVSGGNQIHIFETSGTLVVN